MAASVQPRFGDGRPISFTCAVAVTAGQVVEFTTGTRTVQPAGAASLKVAGVASFDVPTTRSVLGGPQVGEGNELTVFTDDCVILVTFAAAANPGDRLMTAANGQVTPVTVATQDARTIIGYCFGDGPIAAGAQGLMELSI